MVLPSFFHSPRKNPCPKAVVFTWACRWDSAPSTLLHLVNQRIHLSFCSFYLGGIIHLGVQVGQRAQRAAQHPRDGVLIQRSRRQLRGQTVTDELTVCVS